MLCDVPQLPMPQWWSNMWWRGQKDGGVEGYMYAGTGDVIAVAAMKEGNNW